MPVSIRVNLDTHDGAAAAVGDSATGASFPLIIEGNAGDSVVRFAYDRLGFWQVRLPLVRAAVSIRILLCSVKNPISVVFDTIESAIAPG
jgi:hypothetical protein